MLSTVMDAVMAANQTWDDDLYKFCVFENFSVEGQSVSGNFIDCTLRGVDWYWGFFSGVMFLRCRFEACVFSGSNFTDGRFIECTFVNTRFQKDNLGGDCDFTGAVAYDCELLDECSGFEPQKIVGGGPSNERDPFSS